MIIGKNIDDALKVTNQDVADYLDGLPPQKMHCSVMGREALEAAIANYKGEDYVHDNEESPLICKCFGIDESKIVRAIKENNLKTVEDVTNYTKAGGACGSCIEKIEEIIKKTLDEMAGDAYYKNQKDACCEHDHEHDEDGEITVEVKSESGEYTGPVNEEVPFYQAVVDIIERMKPALAQDGGDVVLKRVTADRVEVELSGACTGCMMTDMTLSWIQQQIMEAIGEYIQVVNVGTASHDHFHG
jgi:NifU-like protein